MKIIYLVLVFSFVHFTAIAQDKAPNTQIPDPAKKIQKVEVACGECQFGMHGNDCELAVRIKGKKYFVDGTGINDHGNAHAEDGFCNAVRKAEVQGEIVNDRFVVTYFKLLKPGKKQ